MAVFELRDGAGGLRAAGLARPVKASWIVIGLAIVGLVLRARLMSNSLFEDELSTYYIVTGHGLSQIFLPHYGHALELNPPLLFLFSWIAERLGSSPELLRLPSLLAGVATIPLVFAVGVRTVGRNAAITAAALVALSPFLIFYSSQARPYALMVFLVLAATLALVMALGRGERRWWVVYGICSCAVMYTQYTGVFVLGAQAVWAFIFWPGARRPLLVANVCATLGFVPWIPTVIRDSHSFEIHAYAILDPFTPRAVVHDAAVWAIGQPWTVLEAVPGTAAVVMVLIALVLALAGTTAGVVEQKTLKVAGRSLVILPFVLAVAAPLGLVLYSLVRPSLWDPRNLSASWPGLALAASWLLTSVRRPLRFAAVALAVGGFAVGAVSLMSRSHERPDYTAAAELVIHEGARGSAVAIEPAPGPGPLAAMDAAFAYAGQPGRPLLRIGAPSLQALLHAPRFAFLPPTPTTVLAEEANRTPPGGNLFVIVPGIEPLEGLLVSRSISVRRALGPVLGTGGFGTLMATVFPPLSSFVRAIMPRFRYVGTKTFPGVFRISVYVFQRQ
jgi:Dolichyl-phosphate-mannose-protein mannosyltransferase